MLNRLLLLFLPKLGAILAREMGAVCQHLHSSRRRNPPAFKMI